MNSNSFLDMMYMPNQPRWFNDYFYNSRMPSWKAQNNPVNTSINSAFNNSVYGQFNPYSTFTTTAFPGASSPGSNNSTYGFSG